MKLSSIAKMACKYAYEKRRAGSAPAFLGLEGMLALMYDNIRRYGKNASYDEILDLAANAIFALEAAIQKTDVQTGYSHDDIYDQQLDIVERIQPTRKKEPDPLPDRFVGWNYDADLATELKEWLQETGNWELLTDSARVGIEEVIHGDTDAKPQGEEEEDSISEEEEESDTEEPAEL